MGYYEFPHTRNYDTDLGYLIKRYFELNVDFESLEKNFNDLKAWCIAQLNSEALKTLVANKLDEWLQDGTLASLINNALLHVTTYDTVVEMLTHTGLENGSKIYCAGADSVNDGKGGHFRIRARLSTDNIDNYNLYLIDGGIKVAERLSSANKIYNNVEDLKKDLTIIKDTTAQILGYYDINDLGGATYHITDIQPEGYFITLDNGLFATIIVNKNIVPEMFGAKGDGVHDDRESLQTAIDFCKNKYTLYLNQKDYAISNTLNITHDYFTMIGEQASEYKPVIKFLNQPGENDILISVTAAGCEFSNFIIRTSIDNQHRIGIGIVFDANNHNGNIDALLENMSFFWCGYGIKVYGRNIKINNCIFSTTNNGINLYNTTITSEYRGYDINNNRFHNVSCCVYNHIDNATLTQSILIKNNFIDAGSNALYIGKTDGLFIANNYMKDTAVTTTAFISLLGSNNIENICTISNNYFNGKSLDGSLKARACIEIENSNMYINITNNTMFNFSGTVIKNSGSVTIININDNYISLGSNKAVEVLAQTNRGNVSNNLLISNSTLENIISVPGFNFNNQNNIVSNLN